MSEWQPIETAPSGVRVLVHYPQWRGGMVVPGIYHNEPYHGRGRRGWRVSINPADRWEWYNTAPTHWMPFPEPPSFANVLEGPK